MTVFPVVRSASAAAARVCANGTSSVSSSATAGARRFTTSALLRSVSPLVRSARYGRPSSGSGPVKTSPGSAPLASYSESANGRGAHMTTSASLPVGEHAESGARARRPVGPFRAGVVGFLAGSVIAGVVTYYYILKEYRVSNDLLMTDIYNLQKAINRTEAYVHALEGRADPTKKTRLGD